MIFSRRHWHIGLYSSLILALVVGYVIGHSMPDYKHTIHRQLFADNMTTASVYLFVAYVYWMRIKKLWPADDVDRLWTQFGAIATMLCWALHRVFWAIWRHYLDVPDLVYADWWRDTISALTSILQILIWMFAIVMIWPTVRKHLKGDRWWVPGLTIPTVWILWFAFQTVV